MQPSDERELIDIPKAGVAKPGPKPKDKEASPSKPRKPKKKSYIPTGRPRGRPKKRPPSGTFVGMSIVAFFDNLKSLFTDAESTSAAVTATVHRGPTGEIEEVRVYNQAYEEFLVLERDGTLTAIQCLGELFILSLAGLGIDVADYPHGVGPMTYLVELKDGNQMDITNRWS